MCEGEGLEQGLPSSTKSGWTKNLWKFTPIFRVWCAKHSQEYYDYYKQIATNTNSSYKLVFDFYYTSTSYTQPTSTVLIDGKEFTLKLNEWNKVEISLESLIKNFAVYGDENNSLCDTEQANMLGLQIASEGNDVTVYLGNFITENSVSPLDNYQNDVYTKNI